jgi:transforming growth factor-beta-induced protein
MGILFGKSAEIFSGLKENSTFTTANITFSGGVLRIIDIVLTVPLYPALSAIDS